MSSRIPVTGCSTLRSGLRIDIPKCDLTSSESEAPSTTQARMSAVKKVGGPRPVPARAISDNPPRSCRFIPLRSSTETHGLQFTKPSGRHGGLGPGPTEETSEFKQDMTGMPSMVVPQGWISNEVDLSLSGSEGPSDRSACKGLIRQATLLSQGVTPARNAAELKSLLGNSRAKIKSGAKLLPPPSLLNADDSTMGIVPPAVSLEQGKPRARVEMDMLLGSDIYVEGGYITGNLHVKIHQAREKDLPMLMGGGKLRVVGYEGMPDNNTKHTFFQHAVQLSAVSSSSHVLYSSPPNEEGFSHVCEGLHIIPFAMKLPISHGPEIGAKGPFDNGSGVVVKYIVIASFKLTETETSKCSIAHFYRGCKIYPYFNQSVILAPAIRPLFSTASRSVLLGGPGKIKLTANLHRNVWLAGQECCVGIVVDNKSRKSVKCLTISLIRTTAIFQPNPHLVSRESSSSDSTRIAMTRKLVAETTIEAGQRGLKGHVTEKGWWVGVDPDIRMSFSKFIHLPHDTLSIARGRLLEITYAIRVSLVAGSLSSEVSVMLPLRIISPLSVDPPPSYLIPLENSEVYASAPLISIPHLDPVPESSHSVAQCNNQSGRTSPTTLFNNLRTESHVGTLETPTLTSANPEGYCSPTHMSSLMPELEEGLDMEDVGQYSSSHGICSGGSTDTWTTNDGNVDEFVSGRPFVNNEALDLLGDLSVVDSDEGLNSLGGSAALDNFDGMDGDVFKRVTKTSVNEEPVSAKDSACFNGNHTSYEHMQSRLPIKVVTPVEMNRSRNGLQSSISTAQRILPTSLASSLRQVDPISESSKAPRAKINNNLSSHVSAQPDADGSWHGKTAFSRRVDKLVAVRRATASSTGSTVITRIGKINSLPDCSGTQTDKFPPAAEHRLPCPEKQVPSLSGNNRMLYSSNSSRVVPGGIGMVAVFSGSVRLRIAELESRTAGAVMAD